MSSPFAQQLAAVRELLPTLTPVTQPTLQFTAVQGDLDIAEEPGTSFRTFAVDAESSAPLSQSYLATRSRQAKKRFTVTVLYDSSHKGVGSPLTYKTRGSGVTRLSPVTV